MIQRTSVPKCEKVGNWSVRTNTPDFESPVVESGKYQGVFGVGGLLLARIPLETVAED